MVTVLILGGLAQDATRHLLPFLLSPSLDAAHRPSFVRIVDRALVIPAADAYTTYVDTACRAALKSGTEKRTVEYLQGNLLTEPMRERAFTLPEAHGGASKGFDWVFDFTGETDFNAPEVVHVERTLRLALLLGQSAVKHKVGAYVRALPSFYRLVKDKKGKVGAEGEAAAPWGVMSSWHHEAARGLANMEGLNLVLVRPALLYGPFTVTGITPRALIGEVYKFQNEKLEFLWSESLPHNTVHAHDYASALVHSAAWAVSLGSRAAVLAAHSEPLPSTLSSDAQVAALGSLGAATSKDEVRAAVFNAADDGETTQKDIAKLIAEVIGVKSGFHGSVISSFAKLNIGEVVEDVNDKHLEGWSDLLQASNPPILTNMPISPAVPADLLGPHPISFDNGALKRLTGWKPRYRLTGDVLRETVEGFRHEGNWPNARPKGKK
ncbi:hypothetical protein Rhopal_000086-T1 [Rhodotorula paludigena]|uniref:Uncharacterized protein n=1 Tax=Rhodotorula paludigena TaxID=86838 RepID=A0AAV5G467_9BASI|nr:hypothetical protein Rhopal_000086-T1 [Rhodotorula paludigena]